MSSKNNTSISLNSQCVEVSQNVANDNAGTVSKPPGIFPCQNVDTVRASCFEDYPCDHSSVSRPHQVSLTHVTSEQT